MRFIFNFSFLLIWVSFGACFAQTKVGDKGQQIHTQRSYLEVNKLYDAESETGYFLSRIDHRDRQGHLIKLHHAQSNKDVGEAVRAFAQRKQTDFAINASMGYLTGKNPQNEDTRKAVGIQIVEGNLVQNRKTRVYTLGIHKDNRLQAYPPGTQAQEILDDGVENALTAFVPLIQAGEPVPDTVLNLVGNMTVKHPRQVIAQFDNLDLLILSCGGRGFDGAGMTAKDVIRILMPLDVQFAFMLDGGGSVSTVIGDKLITKKIDKHGTKERLRPNFLYIKTKSND